MQTLRTRDADSLADFVRAAGPLAARAVRLTADDGVVDPVAQAGRLVEHWRREAALLSAAAGLGGKVTSAAQGAVSAAVQGSLVLCLADLAGVTDRRERVALLARTCLDAELPRDWSPDPAPPEPAAPADERSARAAVVELAKQAWAVRRVVDNRTEGRIWHRGLAAVPVVGAAGALLGERHALREVADRARRELSLGRGTTF